MVCVVNVALSAVMYFVQHLVLNNRRENSLILNSIGLSVNMY